MSRRQPTLFEQQTECKSVGAACPDGIRVTTERMPPDDEQEYLHVHVDLTALSDGVYPNAWWFEEIAEADDDSVIIVLARPRPAP
jgi:hypothetical protein